MALGQKLIARSVWEAHLASVTTPRAATRQRRQTRPVLKDGQPTSWTVRSVGDNSYHHRQQWSTHYFDPDGRLIGSVSTVGKAREAVALLLLGMPEVVDDRYLDADGKLNAVWTADQMSRVATWLNAPPAEAAALPEIRAMLAEVERAIRDRIADLLADDPLETDAAA